MVRLKLCVLPGQIDNGTATTFTDTSKGGTQQITVELDDTYNQGFYVDGSRWIEGSPTVNSSTASGANGPVDFGGAMLRPAGDGTKDQGYHSLLYAFFNQGVKESYYESALNEALLWPKQYAPGDCLIFSRTLDILEGPPGFPPAPGGDGAGPHALVNFASCITCVATPPAPNTFRPPYAAGGASFPTYTLDDVDLSFLPSLYSRSVFENAGETVQSIIDAISGLNLDHTEGFLNRYVAPHATMANYGRDLSRDRGSALLALCCNDLTAQEKLNLAIPLIQIGIDCYQLLVNGHRWEPDGGHMSGRLACIMLAGLALDNSDMLNVVATYGLSAFGETAQTFYIDAATVSTGTGYTAGDIGRAEWGIRHATVPAQDNAAWDIPYRLNGTAHTWQGMAVLFDHVPALKTALNHQAFFDYMQFYMENMPGDPFDPGTTHPANERAWEAWHGTAWDAAYAETTPIGFASMENYELAPSYGVRQTGIGLPQGALSPITSQVLQTDTGLRVDWLPTQTRNGEPSLYPDGSYRYITIFIADTLASNEAKNYVILRVDGTPLPAPTFTVHPDVEASIGNWPITGTHQAGREGRIWRNLDGNLYALLGPDDPCSWELIHDGFLAKVWRGHYQVGSYWTTTYLTFGHNQNHAEVAQADTFSDQTTTSLNIISSGHLFGPRNMRFCPLRPWMVQSSSPYTYASQNFTVYGSGNRLGDAQSVPLRGYLIFGENPTGIDLTTQSSLLVTCQGSAGGRFPALELTPGRSFRDGHLGPRGIAPGRHPGFLSDSEEVGSARALGQLLRDQATPASQWSPIPNLQTAEWPPGPGGKPGDGINPWWMLQNTGAGSLISALRIVAHQEWWRPSRRLEADGSLVLHDQHPDLVFFEGYVFRPGDPANDGLGKTQEYNRFSDGVGGWSFYDSSHHDCFNLLTFAYMTGDFLTLELLDWHREIICMETPTEARYLASNAIGNQFLQATKGQQRKCRGVRTGLWIEHLSPRTETRAAMLTAIEEQWGLAALDENTSGGGASGQGIFPPAANWGDMVDGFYQGTLETDSGPNALATGVQACVYWQTAFTMDCVLSAHAMSPGSVPEAMLTCWALGARAVEQLAYRDTQLFNNGYHFLTYTFWNSGNQIPAAELPPLMSYNPGDGRGNNAGFPRFKTAQAGQENWMMAIVQMAGFVLAPIHGATAIEERAKEIVDDWIQRGMFGTTFATPTGEGPQHLAVAVSGLFSNYPHSV